MLDPTTAVILMLVAMLAMIAIGIHIGLALGTAALVGTYLLFGDMEMAMGMIGSAAFFVLRDFIFAVIPLFVLMGEFVSKSGSAGDLYRLMNRALKGVPARLSVATVWANAVFAAVTGVSVASAAAFSRLSYPEMIAAGYDRKFALGSIAGSACLGMLIPPSVLMIIWGIITETSIGFLFLAGILPGIILAALMALYCIVVATARPELAPSAEAVALPPLTRAELVSGLGVVVLIIVVLGSLYGGFTTPSESAAIGALGGLVHAILKGLRWKEIREAIVDSGKVIAPIMFLLLTAQMYTRFVTNGGVANMITDTLTGSGLSNFWAIVLMMAIWLFLGCLLDSGSIILLSVPIFWPVAQIIGYNEYSFAIMGILAIEAGLLTPPVGLLVYTVKGAVPDPSVSLAEIFLGAIPYWIMILIVMVAVWVLPGLATAPITWGTGIEFTHKIGWGF